MTKKERETLFKVDSRLEFLMEKMPVNGIQGLPKVLAQHHEDLKSVKGEIGELKVLTHTLKTKRDMRLIFRKYLEDRPVLKVIFSIATDKRLIVILIGALLTWLGHVEIGKFFIKLF